MKKIQLLSFVFIAAFSACNKGGDYDKAESGLQYRLLEKNEGDKVKEGEWISINLTWRNETDSVIQTASPTPFRVVKPSYAGDIMEGFTMLALNDSASFLLSVDSLFKSGMPPFAKAGTFWKLDVRVKEIMTDQQVQEKMMAEQQEAMRMAAVQMEADIKTIEAYLAEKKIKTQRTESGIFYVVEKEGKGDNAKAGNQVSVHYTGMLLDGTVFESSRQGNEPVTFTLGQAEVIPGWDEGITLFKKGGKGKLFLPSPLAYGNRQRSDIIKPNSILIFEIELVDVK